MEDSPGEPKRRKHKKTGAEKPIEVLESGLAKLPLHPPAKELELENNVEEEVLSIWAQLDGCDPVPVIVNPNMTVHDLKLLLGGFQASSSALHTLKLHRMVQKQQIDLLGLIGIRPQQLKLKVDNNALSPPSLLSSVVSEGSIVAITIVQSPVTPALTNSTALQGPSTSTDLETQRFMNGMRHELDYLRRRLLAPTPTDLRSVNTSDDPTLAVPGDPLMDPAAADTFVNRLELLEAKLDLKNTQLETIMKELKTVTLALRGLAPAVAPGGLPEKGPSNIVDGLPNVKCKQTIDGHAGPVWALAKTDTYLISGSTDTTVQAWDLQSMRPVHTMRGHSSIVHSVEVWNNTIISGSDDRCVKFWDMDQNFKCTKTLRANNVPCVLRAASNHLFAGLYKTVKVWNLESGELAGDLDNHNHWVRALNVTKGHLYSGCYNVINMIDLGTFKHMKSMTGNVGSIYSIVVDNNMLYAGTYANAICVYDLRTFECVRTLTGHTGAVYSLALSKGTGKLYSGSYDTTIRVWDLNSLTPVQRFVGHSSSVEALMSTEAGIYSASTDATIKLWR